jgi:hypothetical protein
LECETAEIMHLVQIANPLSFGGKNDLNPFGIPNNEFARGISHGGQLFPE